jgi:hypothetical protein
LDGEEGGIESRSRNTVTWKEHLVSLEEPYGKKYLLRLSENNVD